MYGKGEAGVLDPNTSLIEIACAAKGLQWWKIKLLEIVLIWGKVGEIDDLYLLFYFKLAHEMTPLFNLVFKTCGNRRTSARVQYKLLSQRDI